MDTSGGEDDVVGDAAQLMNGTAQLSILNSLLSSTTKAKFMVPSSIVAFTGYDDKIKEEQWMRMEQTTKAEWIPFREDLEPWPLQIRHEDGYVREQGVEGEYKNQLKKDGFPLMEKDRYKSYYREYFFSPETKQDLLRHYIFMSRLEDEEVNNIGSVIICCEAKPAPPVPLNKHSIKALIWTKKGQERVTISLKALADAGSPLKAVKEEASYLQPIRFNRIKDSLNVKEKLLKYEKQNVQVNYKFGVLFSREHQSVEDQMYNNEHGSPAFEEFLDFLGTRTTLQGFQGYRGGLDVKSNTTGTQTIYTQYKGSEIMFHVSTLLQYYPADPQQVERKRHLGNDVVLIVFREGENEPFSPKWIRSQFNHVFIVVTPVPHPKGKPGTWYKVAISCKEGVIPFQPRLPYPPYFRKGKKAQEWFLSKLINAERAAFHAPDFVMKFRNTRKIQLRNIVEECLPEKEGILSRSMTGSKIKNIAKGAKAVIHKGDDGRHDDDESIADTTTFTAKWYPGGEGSKAENVVVDVSPREIVFKDPKRDFNVVERYTYFQVKRWAIGQGIVGLDLGPYREKGMIKITTDRSEEIGLLLSEYVNVIKAQLEKKPPQASGSPTVRSGQETRSPEAALFLSGPAGLGSSQSTIPSASSPSSSQATTNPTNLFLSSGQAPRFPQVPLSPRPEASNPGLPSRSPHQPTQSHNASCVSSMSPSGHYSNPSPPITPSASPPAHPPLVPVRRPTPPRPPLAASFPPQSPDVHTLAASTSALTLASPVQHRPTLPQPSMPASKNPLSASTQVPLPKRPIPPVPQRRDTVVGEIPVRAADEDTPLRPPRPTRATKKPAPLPDFLNQPTPPPRTSYRGRKGGSVTGGPYSGAATMRVSRRSPRPDPSAQEDNSVTDLPFLDAELPPVPQRAKPIPPVPPRRKDTNGES